MGDVVLGAVLLFVPVRRQLVVAVDGDVSHAADEAVLAVDASADHVVGAGGDVQDALRLHFLVVDGQDGAVFGDGQLDGVPLAVVKRLVEVVQLHLRHVRGHEHHLDPGVFHHHLDEPFGAEPVVHQEPLLLVSPELEADVETVRPFVAGQADEGLAVLEGDGDGEVVDGTTLHHAADVVVVVEPVVVQQAVLEAGDDVGMVEIHVFDASGEILKDDQALLDVGDAADVQVAVQVEPVEVSLDSVPDPDAIDGKDDVAALSGNDDFVEDVVVQERSQSHGRLHLGSQIDVQQQPVFHHLESDVISLGTAAVQNDSVFVVGFEPEAERVSERRHGMSGQVSLDHAFPVKVQHVRNVIAAVKLHSQRYPVDPARRVHSDPLGNDGLVEIVALDVIAVLVAPEQLGRPVHLLVIREILAVGPVLNHVLHDVLLRVGSALGRNPGHVLDGPQVNDQGLLDVRVFRRPRRAAPELGIFGFSVRSLGRG